MPALFILGVHALIVGEILAAFFLLFYFLPGFAGDSRASCEDIRVLNEIALQTEYGRPLSGFIKWAQKDVYVDVVGEPSTADLQALDRVLTELNALQSELRLERLSSGDERVADITFYFQPHRLFSKIEKAYIAHNKGFFSIELSNQRAIQYAKILISTTDISQAERNHLIREELTQSLGLVNDSRDPESIFYKNWSHLQNYSHQDKRLIKLFYSPAVKLGHDLTDLNRELCLQDFAWNCILTTRFCDLNGDVQ